MMAFNFEAFKKSVLEPQEKVTKDEPKPDDKWPVKGYIIREAWSMTDDVGEYFLLIIDGNGEVGGRYVLRDGDLPALPFATELDRELQAGLIEIKPGPPPEITPLTQH